MTSHPMISPADEPAVAQNRETFRRAGLAAVAVIGPPGGGKTSLIEATARRLRDEARVAVLVVNPAADRDASRVARYCRRTVALNASAATARAVRSAVNGVDLNETDLLLIESLGGIGGAPDLGQDVTVAVLAVSGGDDKAAEYAALLSACDVLLLAKSDLRTHVLFDRDAFLADVRRINPGIEVIEVSAFENRGLTRWLAWIDRLLREKNPGYRPAVKPEPRPELYFG